VAEPPERWCPQSGAAGVDTIGMQVKCLYPAASDAAHAAVNLWFSGRRYRLKSRREPANSAVCPTLA
jgi:hypothetical protein